jgi:hypothetical protein
MPCRASRAGSVGNKIPFTDARSGKQHCGLPLIVPL